MLSSCCKIEDFTFGSTLFFRKLCGTPIASYIYRSKILIIDRFGARVYILLRSIL